MIMGKKIPLGAQVPDDRVVNTYQTRKKIIICPSSNYALLSSIAVMLVD